MSDELSDLKLKIAELEARQQVAQAPSKPNPGGPALRRMFTYAALLIIVPIFVFAIANYEATPARGVSTVADVVAHQKKAEETLAQIYRYCDHAAEVEEHENGALGYFGRVAFKSKCQRRMLGVETTTATSVIVLATRLPFYFASRWRQIRTRAR